MEAEEGQSDELEEMICNEQGVSGETRRSCSGGIQREKREETDMHAGIKRIQTCLQKPLRNL